MSFCVNPDAYQLTEKQLQAYLRMVLKNYQSNGTFIEIPQHQQDHIVETFLDLIKDD